MSEIVSSLTALAAVPAVRESSQRARDACTRLRWHPALRRRAAEAAAESRVRGAWASAELDGARSSVDLVRDLVRGARPRPDPPDPAEALVIGAVTATMESERLGGVVMSAPAQAVARLHVSAAAGLLGPEQLGRPRRAAEETLELVELGRAPAPDQVAVRLAALGEVLAAREVPAPLIAAVVHAEIATTRPFVRGNGLVARAMERAVIAASGLDPTGVAVPEVGHAAGGRAYLGGLTAYATGTREGVVLWLTSCGEALERAAGEGARVADAVLAGRLPTGGRPGASDRH